MRRIKLLNNYENVFIFWWETIILFINFAALGITLGSSSYINVKFKRTHLIQVVFRLTTSNKAVLLATESNQYIERKLQKFILIRLSKSEYFEIEPRRDCIP